MKKYAVWCIALVLLVTLPLLAACTGEEVLSTPKSTITPTATTPKSTPTATTPAETKTPTPTSTATPAPTPAATETVTPTEEPEPANGGIPPIPHPVDGRAACLLCHASGVGGANVVPADHEGRTNDSCTMCHQPL